MLLCICFQCCFAYMRVYSIQLSEKRESWSKTLRFVLFFHLFWSDIVFQWPFRQQKSSRRTLFFLCVCIVSGNSCLSSGLSPWRGSPARAWPPAGVTGSLVRSQGAVASNGGALHLVSRPQETGKQNLLLHAVLPTLNHLPWPNQVTPSSITSEQIL